MKGRPLIYKSHLWENGKGSMVDCKGWYFDKILDSEISGSLVLQYENILVETESGKLVRVHPDQITFTQPRIPDHVTDLINHILSFKFPNDDT